ncbi:MAG: hypothetical protein H7326_08905 [Bdellovibrionaceae bacterium]|nr:hypothetical protein [Pseudobdellovibrionaceae bacterium]
MKKILLSLTVLLSTSAAFAGYHTGYCRYGEECSGIVSQDQREAQRTCSREVFDKKAMAVRQQQADGSVIFIGFACVTPTQH